jgi:hypothetical protein
MLGLIKRIRDQPVSFTLVAVNISLLKKATMLKIIRPKPSVYGVLRDLFSFAVLSGNAAWLCTFVARERGKRENGTNGGEEETWFPFFSYALLLPFVPFTLFSPSFHQTGKGRFI